MIHLRQLAGWGGGHVNDFAIPMTESLIEGKCKCPNVLVVSVRGCERLRLGLQAILYALPQVNAENLS